MFMLVGGYGEYGVLLHSGAVMLIFYFLSLLCIAFSIKKDFQH